MHERRILTHYWTFLYLCFESYQLLYIILASTTDDFPRLFRTLNQVAPLLIYTSKRAVINYFDSLRNVFHSFRILSILEASICAFPSHSLDFLFFLSLEGFFGQSLGRISPCPWATMSALHLNCSIAALPTPQKILSNWELVELMLDFSNRTGTGISILTSAAHKFKFFRLWFEKIDGLNPVI